MESAFRYGGTPRRQVSMLNSIRQCFALVVVIIVALAVVSYL
jgi:hypothetical protein